MKRWIALWVAVVAVYGTCALASDTPKQAGPYDPSLDGWKQLQGAAQKAGVDDRPLLVIVGGNWCKWCRALERLTDEDAALRGELAAHYEVVHLNWSKENNNSKAMKRLGHPEKLGFPAFVVVSAKLEVLHTQETSAFESPASDHPGYDVPKMLAFLKQWEQAH